MQHFLHYAIHYCPGYQRFLEKQRSGKIFLFNWHYFFFSLFLLARLRMFGLFFIVQTIYFFPFFYILKNLGPTHPLMVSFLYILCVVHILFSFIFNYFYQIHINKILWQTKYDEVKVFKKVRPIPFILDFLVFLILASIYNKFFVIFA